MLDRCLWTAPAKLGTGAASTWLVGSAEDVIASLEAYVALGISKFILSDTPYLDEAERCHRLGFMAGGKILALDTPRGLLSRMPDRLVEILLEVA